MSGTQLNLRIDGMHCGACIRRVSRSLQSVPGVEVEEVRLGAARVTLASVASVNDLIVNLGKAGFAAQQEL